jgi:hypothetical protein
VLNGARGMHGRGGVARAGTRIAANGEGARRGIAHLDPVALDHVL